MNHYIPLRIFKRKPLRQERKKVIQLKYKLFYFWETIEEFLLNNSDSYFSICFFWGWKLTGGAPFLFLAWWRQGGAMLAGPCGVRGLKNGLFWKIIFSSSNGCPENMDKRLVKRCWCLKVFIFSEFCEFCSLSFFSNIHDS